MSGLSIVKRLSRAFLLSCSAATKIVIGTFPEIHLWEPAVFFYTRFPGNQISCGAACSERRRLNVEEALAPEVVAKRRIKYYVDATVDLVDCLKGMKMVGECV